VSEHSWLRIVLACAAAVGVGLAWRYGPSPRLAEVQGTVHLDGEPLANALIVFQPQGEGTYSSALTDERGHYRLIYTRHEYGALLGRHSVSITTVFDSFGDNSGKQPGSRERIPPQYNEHTLLVADVVSGLNEFNFSLESSDRGTQRNSL
jgi:hypothetical protein